MTTHVETSHIETSTVDTGGFNFTRKPSKFHWRSLPVFAGGVAVVLLVMVLVLFSVWTTLNVGKSVTFSAGQLATLTVPKLTTISTLQSAVNERAINAFLLYTSANQNNFAKKDRSLAQEFQIQFDQLKSFGISDKYESTIQRHYLNLDQSIDNLQRQINDGADSGRIRQILAEIQSSTGSIVESLGFLADEVRKEINYSGTSTVDDINNLTYMQILFSLGILIATAYAINSFAQRFKDSEELRHLSVFPERNPGPVIRVSLDGDVDYMNPAAKSLMSEFNISNPIELLPDDWRDRYQKKLSNKSVYQYESQFGDKTFLANTSFQPDLKRFHIYLEDISIRKSAEKELARRAFFDDLTGLPNRRQLEEILEHFIAVSPERIIHATLIQINLDRFKLVNGTHGHLVGDRLIQGVTKWLINILKDDDVKLFRHSSASWMLIRLGEANVDATNVLVKKILNLSNEPIDLGDRWMSVSCSIGIVYAPRDGTQIDRLLGNTDSAVSSARQAGGNCFYEYSEKLKLAAETWLDTENGLRDALAHNQFELYFQPKVFPGSGNIAGAEVLIRWRRNGTMVSPAVFIPVAEQSGLIEQIGDWVLRTTCIKWSEWLKQGYAQLPVAVNISAQQFQRVDFPELVSRILEETQMDPRFLELEITEAVAADQPEKVVNTMLALRKIGVSLAIDDFGTGYSSLSYLQRFPINTLKIDQAFVSKIKGEDSNSAIARLILSVSRELGFKVVAEGVETDIQHQFLASWGCDLLQGYLFSKPVSESEYLQRIMLMR